MGTPTLALTALEIAVGGGGAAFTGLQAVGIHAQAHGATRRAPLEPGGLENPVQPLALGLQAHQARAWYHQRLLDTAVDLPATQHIRRRTQILDSRVGAGTNENPV